MRKLVETLVYVFIGYVFISLTVEYLTSDHSSSANQQKVIKYNFSFRKSKQLATSKSSSRFPSAYVENNTFYYDTPTKTYSPDLDIREVPLTPFIRNDTKPDIKITTIYETSLLEATGAEKEKRKIEPLNSYFRYCSEPQSFAERQSSNKRAIDPNIKTNDGDPLKKILFWNPFFTQGDYHVGFNDDIFRICECPVRCWLTNNKSEQATADAIIMHTFYLREEGTIPPERTHQDQLLIFYLFENPMMAWDGMLDYNYTDYFNLTMTYMDHRDTDIYIPTGDVRKRIPGHPYNLPSLDFITAKERPLAWVVSNCAPFSERTAYVNKLSKHIEVDIFGKCGKLSCPEQNDFGHGCMKNLTKKYFFYLALENTYCDGYISEKTFRTMFFDMVPVVYGGGDYAKLLPRKSYIDVRDFKSPKDLARYLGHLMKNPKEYLEYFRWKEHAMIVADDYHRARGFCKLCQILNTPSYPYKSNFDLLSYWNPDTRCKKGKEERKAVNLRI